MAKPDKKNDGASVTTDPGTATSVLSWEPAAYGDRSPTSYDAQIAGQLLKDNELSAENVALCNQVIASWACQFRDVAGAED